MVLPFQLLAIIGSAAFAGVMIAISLILGAFWRGLPPADFLVWFAAHSGLIARTIPVVAVPTLVGLVGATALTWGDATTRTLWLLALGCVGALLVLTVVYFLPMNAAFNEGSVALAEVPRQIDAWLAMHWVRIGLALVASGLGVIAVTR